MEIYKQIQDVPKILKPIVLTIGNFDGVHAGHRALLQKAKEKAVQHNGFLLVLTFSNHPFEVLRPEASLQQLCTLEEKLKRLEKQNVDAILLLEFNQNFARQTAEEFLNALYRDLAFDVLILGYDAKLGSDRQANNPAMHNLAAKMNYELIYTEPYKVNGQIVSSSLIRQLL